MNDNDFGQLRKCKRYFMTGMLHVLHDKTATHDMLMLCACPEDRHWWYVTPVSLKCSLLPPQEPQRLTT